MALGRGRKRWRLILTSVGMPALVAAFVFAGCSSAPQQAQKKGGSGGCGGEQDSGSNDDEDGDSELWLQSAPVYYEPQIQTLMTKCTGCHGATGRSPKLSNYTEVKTSALSAYATLPTTATRKMPPAPAAQLATNEVAQFKAWIDAGMPERGAATTTGTGTNTGTGTVVATGTMTGTMTGTVTGTMTGTGTGSVSGGGGDVTYYGHAKKILDKYCTTCHSPDTKDESPDLSTYKAAKKQIAAAIASIEDASMPPKKTKKKLKTSELEKLKAWQAGGLEKGEEEDEDCE